MKRFNLISKFLHFVDNTLNDHYRHSKGNNFQNTQNSGMHELDFKTDYTTERETTHDISILVQINYSLQGLRNIGCHTHH